MSVVGEFWLIDGTAHFADGDVGDMNHERYVVEHVLSEHDLTPEEFEELSYDQWQAVGFTDDELSVVSVSRRNRTGFDPREYAIRELGWIRVADRHVQMGELTQETLEKLLDGLWDAYDNDVFTATFDIWVDSGNRMYYGAPYTELVEGGLVALHRYLHRSVCTQN